MTAVPEVAASLNATSAAHWERKTARLRFLLAGRAVYAVEFPAMVSTVPFTHATSDPSVPPPPPQPFPEGIQAVRIYSCPLEPTVPPITLMPQLIRYVVAQYRHLYVDITGSFEQYLQKFSSKTRWTLRKKLKKFMETAGAGAYREYRDPRAMWEYCSLAGAVSGKTYQQKLLDAGIPQQEDFVLELERLAERGAVRGYILLHGGVPASYALCHAYSDTLTYDKTGFDPQFAHLHPGTVLIYLIIQGLFAEQRFRIFDFGSGDFEYKEFFSTGSVRCADITYLLRTPRNLAVVCAHRGLSVLSGGLKKLLHFVGAEAKIKKLIHRSL